RGMETHEVGPYEFHDKIPLKRGLAAQGVRLVPPGHIRYGAFCERGVVVMPGARPVIVEDGAFLGSRSIVVEGVRIGREAVLGANVVLTASTPIVDVRGPTEIVTRGAIPPRAVVIPGMRPKAF